MALKITQQRETFLVEGTINAMTALNFQNHLKFALKACDELVINIENVVEIDTNGMNAMRFIYNESVALDKKIYIVGTGCKEVYDDLYYNNVA
ncbi:STAS domain-containing protein [Thalassobellus sediminis]|uniref:STAS domain-containing protein n=1 Tax=Thalassobellus sediminis TaxID=3367753 RepID=UPI0037B4AE68